MTPIVVLGVTGSIGAQTLDVAARAAVPIAGIAAGSVSDKLIEVGHATGDAVIGVATADAEQRERLSGIFGERVSFGPEAITDLAALPECVVVNGIVGSAGLAPSVAALEAGNRLALANKESLVAGGPVVIAAAQRGGGEIVPVDSEHSALWQCLVGEDPSAVRRLLLTASGGPFRGRSAAELSAVTIEDALAHPTWEMGPRITVDSATLMNKAFEVIEAHYLFDVPYDAIDVVVHPQSIVHSMVEFVDGSVKAQVGLPDMRHPIQYAITHPDRIEVDADPFDPTGMSLTFERPDGSAFPCLGLGYEAGRAGESAPAVLNAADEVAVEAFLAGRIRFTDIPRIVQETLDGVDHREVRDVDAVYAVDVDARRLATALVTKGSA